MLGGMGFQVLAHPTAWRIAEIYRQFGVDFPNCRMLIEEPDPTQDVLVLPPQSLRTFGFSSAQKFRTLFLSGWAESRQPRNWQRYDQALPLSDHADFDELLAFAESVQPKQVYVLHGFPEFADYLRRAGFQTEFLQKPVKW